MGLSTDDDFIPVNTRDYVVDGPTYDLREEIKAWGGIWNSTEKRWELHGTDPNCQDHKQLKLLGLKLFPIQATSTEKLIRDTLSKHKK